MTAASRASLSPAMRDALSTITRAAWMMPSSGRTYATAMQLWMSLLTPPYHSTNAWTSP